MNKTIAAINGPKIIVALSVKYLFKNLKKLFNNFKLNIVTLLISPVIKSSKQDIRVFGGFVLSTPGSFFCISSISSFIVVNFLFKLIHTEFLISSLGKKSIF